MENIRIMNITNGDEVQGNWTTKKEALDWINSQDVPEMYEIMDVI